MSNQQQKSTKRKLKSFQTDKGHFNKNLFLGSVIATLIAATPFFFYLYEYVPPTQTWETWLFTYHSGFYEDAQTGMWTILMKLIPLFLLFIWFFTCRHWWYHTLIVPIAMFSYQLFSAINTEMKFFDEFQLIYLVPLMALIIPSIYLLRAKMFNHVNDADKTIEELEEEFKLGGGKSVFGKLSDYF